MRDKLFNHHTWKVWSVSLISRTDDQIYCLSDFRRESVFPKLIQSWLPHVDYDKQTTTSEFEYHWVVHTSLLDTTIKQSFVNDYNNSLIKTIHLFI